MRRTPHLDKRSNYDYNPFEQRSEFFVSCSVCGFKGIDAEKWSEPEQAVYSITVNEIADQTISAGGQIWATGHWATGHWATGHWSETGSVEFIPGTLVYAVPAGTSIEGLSTINKNVFTQVRTRSACPFCGSPNWAFGSAPDLLF